MTNDQTTLEKKSKGLTNRQPPRAQLVERRTVEKMISLGPCSSPGRRMAWKSFLRNKFNELFRRLVCEDPEQFSLLVWTNDQKEQKKAKIFLFNESWKTLIKVSVCFFHLVNNVFRWKRIKQSPENTSADSSVGRAEHCRKTDILRS